jgi:hypothetical protein
MPDLEPWQTPPANEVTGYPLADRSRLWQFLSWNLAESYGEYVAEQNLLTLLRGVTLVVLGAFSGAYPPARDTLLSWPVAGLVLLAVPSYISAETILFLRRRRALDSWRVRLKRLGAPL